MAYATLDDGVRLAYRVDGRAGAPDERTVAALRPRGATGKCVERVASS